MLFCIHENYNLILIMHLVDHFQWLKLGEFHNSSDVRQIVVSRWSQVVTSA